MSAPIGNKNAAKAKEWEQALKRAMARKAEGDFRNTLDVIASGVVDLAMGGNKDAWQEIANRMDGKPAQAIEIGSDPDKPMIAEVRWTVRSST